MWPRVKQASKWHRPLLPSARSMPVCSDWRLFPKKEISCALDTYLLYMDFFASVLCFLLYIATSPHRLCVLRYSRSLQTHCMTQNMLVSYSEYSWLLFIASCDSFIRLLIHFVSQYISCRLSFVALQSFAHWLKSKSPYILCLLTSYWLVLIVVYSSDLQVLHIYAI